MYCIYILQSLKDKKTYTGCTKDLDKRLKEHNAGQVYSTRYRIPLILVYKEEFVDKFQAFKREKHLKTAWGRRQLKKILGDLNQST